MELLILKASVWVLLGAIMAHKQYEAGKKDTSGVNPLTGAVLAFVLSPIWFLGSVVRQIFFEKWN